MRDEIERTIAEFEKSKEKAQQGFAKAETTREVSLFSTIIEISDLAIKQLKAVIAEHDSISRTSDSDGRGKDDSAEQVEGQ